MGEDSDFELKEPDSFSGTKGSEFSYSALIMKAMIKCIENGCKEMREGYTDIKRDRYGNAIRVEVPDSRMEFIESVESLKMLSEREFDEEASKAIKKIEDLLNNKYFSYCELEKREWNAANQKIIQQWASEGYFYRENFLSQKFPYYNEYLLEKVSAYRKILSEISKLFKRLDDFREEMWEA